jgi:hypothetical protein
MPLLADVHFLMGVDFLDHYHHHYYPATNTLADMVSAQFLVNSLSSAMAVANFNVPSEFLVMVPQAATYGQPPPVWILEAMPPPECHWYFHQPRLSTA